MATFAILSLTETPAIRTALSSHFGEGHYWWSDTVAFLRASDTAMGVSNRLGITGVDAEGKQTSILSGVIVIEVAADYWGVAKRDAWSFLKSSFEASV